jgi:tetratricopeptide (TPR) repeat protein
MNENAAEVQCRNHIYGLFLRAAIFDCLGRPLDAVKDLSAVVLMDPQNRMAYGLRGAAYSTLKQWHEALGDFNQAVALGDHSEGCTRTVPSLMKTWEIMTKPLVISPGLLS